MRNILEIPCINPGALVRLAHTFPTGGYLGFFCSHAYAHTNTDAIILPDMLKGLDMAVWETFGRLGLEASVKPVLRDEGVKYEERDNWVVGNDRALHLSKVGRADCNEVMDLHIGEWRGGETLTFEEIHWLTDPSHKEIQLPYIAVSLRINASLIL